MAFTLSVTTLSWVVVTTFLDDDDRVQAAASPSSVFVLFSFNSIRCDQHLLPFLEGSKTTSFCLHLTLCFDARLHFRTAARWQAPRSMRARKRALPGAPASETFAHINTAGRPRLYHRRCALRACFWAGAHAAPLLCAHALRTHFRFLWQALFLSPPLP